MQQPEIRVEVAVLAQRIWHINNFQLKSPQITSILQYYKLKKCKTKQTMTKQSRQTRSILSMTISFFYQGLVDNTYSRSRQGIGRVSVEAKELVLPPKTSETEKNV